ncbi:MAG TPA: 2'-5' RNA ligase family protein [Nevskiaceae bacterium]
MPERLRAQHPQDLHITLAFLGDCTPAAALAAWALVEAEPPARATLRLAKPAIFGSGRAIGFDLEGADALCAWMARYRARSPTAIDATSDNRAVRPHLTVAWTRHQRPVDEGLSGIPGLLSGSVGLPIPMATVALCRRAEGNGRTAPRYRTLERLALHA